MEVEIDDVRPAAHFRGISFSGFKKTDVKRELATALYQSNVETACYWSAELICAGHYLDIWEIIIEFFSKHIHTGHPKLVSYLAMRMHHFQHIWTVGYTGHEIRLRNNPKIRRLFAELMCVLCSAPRQHCYTEVKLGRTDFDMTHHHERFRATDVTFANDVFKSEDPKELYIAVNELVYCLTELRNGVYACYWIEWLLEAGAVCQCEGTCARRLFMPVETKMQKDVVWLVWEVLRSAAAAVITPTSPLLAKIVNDALSLFSFKYTTSCSKRRKGLLYFIVNLLTSSASMVDMELVPEETKQKVETVVKRLHVVYKPIKKNEHSSGTDYLHSGLQSANHLEDTLGKLEAMNGIMADGGGEV